MSSAKKRPIASFFHFGCRSSLLLFFTAIVLPLSAHATECGWLETDQLDQAFPQYAPWHVVTGGQIGSCRFLSRSDRAPNVFAANQMIHESEQAAADFIATLRPEMAASYNVMDAPAIGVQGFYYLPTERASEAASRNVGFAGHKGRVTALGSLALQDAVSSQDREAGDSLIQAALAVSDNPEILAAASDCRWFNGPLLNRLLPAGDVTQNVMGENSCFATDSDNALLTVSIQPASEAFQHPSTDDCTIEKLDQLGDHASLSYSCSSGQPRANVQLTIGNYMINYDLIPKQEPSLEQRQALVELADWAQQSNSRR
ncbi:hypothetical protein QT231_15905 [Halomonas sp. SpR1]|uniref:hypothetical protein n=1 Tax=Halomonas sp. SpR1 TaxID=3050462 RepID=UPI0027E44751|nr:hypothetical protein [Halomonas sp. SpR1]MDQ7734198.1 hypothetical protein [Halomonas sp. SpR1]